MASPNATSSFEEDNMRSIGDFSIDLGLGGGGYGPSGALASTSSGSISSISFASSYASMFGESCSSLCQSRWGNPSTIDRSPAVAAAAAAATTQRMALRMPPRWPRRFQSLVVNNPHESSLTLFGESFSTLEGGNNNNNNDATAQQQDPVLISKSPLGTRFIKKNIIMNRNRRIQLPRYNSEKSLDRSTNTFAASFAMLETSFGSIVSTWESDTDSGNDVDGHEEEAENDPEQCHYNTEDEDNEDFGECELGSQSSEDDDDPSEDMAQLRIAAMLQQSHSAKFDANVVHELESDDAPPSTASNTTEEEAE